jgi:hypothetical protein
MKIHNATNSIRRCLLAIGHFAFQTVFGPSERGVSWPGEFTRCLVDEAIRMSPGVRWRIALVLIQGYFSGPGTRPSGYHSHRIRHEKPWKPFEEYLLTE